MGGSLESLLEGQEEGGVKVVVGGYTKAF